MTAVAIDPNGIRTLVAEEVGRALRDFGSIIAVAGTPGPLYPSVAGEIGVVFQQYGYGDIRRYGARVGALWDNTSSIQNAIASVPASGTVTYPAGTWRVVGKLAYNVVGQIHDGGGVATLQWDGVYVDANSRMFDVTAADNTFRGLAFDGNAKQPAFALGYIADNTPRPKFYSCAFQNLLGIAVGTGAVNAMYGLMISPYGVTDFLLWDCRFYNIRKYNVAPQVAVPTIGYGYVGGIWFYNGAEPVAPQPVPTSGVIDPCSFETIKTILAAGLPVATQTELDDGDGIRFYGDPAGANTLNVRVSNCRFYDVSKRAIKGSGGGACRGIIVENIEVDGSAGAYGMQGIVKVDSDSIVRNIIFRGSPTRRVRQGVQIQGNDNILVDGVYADYADIGVVIAPAGGAVPMTKITLANLNFPDCAEGGLEHQTLSPSTESAILLRDCRFVVSGNTSVGILLGLSGDGRCGVTMRNVYVENGDVRLDGDDIDIDGLTVRITSATYDGHYAGLRPLVGIGTNAGLTNSYEIRVANLVVDATGIKTGWCTANRSVLQIRGDKQRVGKVTVIVPETMGTGFPDVDQLGSYSVWDGVTYTGRGLFFIGTTGVTTKSVFRNLVRMGAAGWNPVTVAATPFVYINNAGSGNLVLSGITDVCPSAQVAVNILNGAGYAVEGVFSVTTNPVLVQHGGLAQVAQMATLGAGTIRVDNLKIDTAAQIGAPAGGLPVAGKMNVAAGLLLNNVAYANP